MTEFIIKLNVIFTVFGNFSQQAPILWVYSVFGSLTMAAPVGHLTVKFNSTKFNSYRLITAYLLLRVNLDKIMHAR